MPRRKNSEISWHSNANAIVTLKESVFTFLRAQSSAFIGGISDYLIMIFCTEVLGIFYPISIIISGILGAVVNFSINRNWTYRASDGKLNGQLAKFIFVVLGSVGLKSSGTYLLTSFSNIDYKITRLAVDLLVSLGFNYTLQTYWVFRKKEKNFL